MARSRHQKKEIEAAVAYAESRGWRFVKASSKAHIWGQLFCHQGTRQGCIIRIHSTPRFPKNHADTIRRAVDACTH